jgi:hypothetical protein
MRPDLNRQWCGIRASIWALALLGIVLWIWPLYVSDPAPEPPEASELPARQSQPQNGQSAPAQNVGTARSTEPEQERLRTFLHALSDPDPGVRLNAVNSVRTSALTGGAVISALIACLSDADPRIRAAAAHELGRYRWAAAEAVPMLKPLAKDDPDDAVRNRAREALYNIRLYDFPLK